MCVIVIASKSDLLNPSGSIYLFFTHSKMIQRKNNEKQNQTLLLNLRRKADGFSI